MLISARARADDVRALASAIALGSSAGLLIGAAYLAGGHAGQNAHPAPVPQAAGQAIAQSTVAPAAGISSATSNRGASLGALRDRFRLAGDLTGAVARPFQFHQVANAPSDLNCLTEAVYFEARGEAPEGQKAVAQVVLNRVRHPAFPKTICAVVHQHTGAGCQFTFACSSRQAALDGSAWRRAKDVASAALHGAVMSAVGDATHFQSAHSGPFAGLLRVAQVGAHVFYRFGGREGSAAMFRQTPAPSVQPGRMEIARLDMSGGTEGGLGDDLDRAAKASVARPIVVAPVATTSSPAVASLVSKSPDTRMANAPVEATSILKTPPSPAATGARTPDLAAKPVVSLALAQS